MNLVAAEPPQSIGFGIGLYALGNRLQAQGMAEHNDRSDDVFDGSFVRQAADERTVDLQFVKRKARKVGEIGVTRAEIVE